MDGWPKLHASSDPSQTCRMASNGPFSEFQGCSRHTSRAARLPTELETSATKGAWQASALSWLTVALADRSSQARVRWCPIGATSGHVGAMVCHTRASCWRLTGERHLRAAGTPLTVVAAAPGGSCNVPSAPGASKPSQGPPWIVTDMIFSGVRALTV